MVSTGIGRRFTDGQAIVRQGTPADRLHVVLEGKVVLVREGEAVERPVAVLTSGAVFGELALLDDQRHLVTARARGEVRVLSIDRRALLRRIREDPAFGLRVLQRLAQSVRDLTLELVAREQARRTG